MKTVQLRWMRARDAHRARMLAMPKPTADELHAQIRVALDRMPSYTSPSIRTVVPKMSYQQMFRLKP